MSIAAVTQFVASPQFWYYHGFVLSFLWVIGSALAIFFKKAGSLTLHALSFFCIDVTTLFFGGGALYRVFPHIQNFMSWSPIKQGHIAGGIIFLVLVIIQHLGGVLSFLKNQRNPQHRKFGFVLVNIGRIIAAFGWILGGNDQNAMIVGVLSVILFVGALAFKGGKGEKSEGKERSKSPRAKRD